MIHLFKRIEKLAEIKGKKQLTNSEVEECFQTLNKTLSKQTQESLFKEDENILKNEEYNLFINLSQIQFATLSAINYLVLHIDIICKENKIKNVYIALPTIGNTIKELKSNNPNYTKEIRNSDKEKRSNANSFLKNVNFIKILRETVEYHQANTFFTEKYQFESTFQTGAFEKAFEVIDDFWEPSNFGYHFLYPLEWIYTKNDNINYNLIQDKFHKTLTNPERGLDNFDVKAIKNVIFYELQKNVIEHTPTESKPKRFLLSIGLIASFNNSGNELEATFYDFLKKENVSSVVEIYFGDSGGGFFTKDFVEKCKNENIKDPSEQLKWAFKRWSTKKFDEERRGTKGLYRILRIVNNYKGIVHITTNGYNGGYFLGNKWKYRKTTPFKGTFLQLKLCPYSIIKEFKFDINSNPLKTDWKTIILDINDNINSIKTTIQNEFKFSEDKSIFLILDIDKKEYDTFQHIESFLNDILLEISFNANPSGAVVFINSKEGSNTISNLINSTDEYIRNKTALDISEEYDNEDIYDPIITIHDGKMLWYGGSREIISILDELYDDNFNKRIFELKSFDLLDNTIKTRIRQNLENDNSLVSINSIGEVKLNFINLDQHFLEILSENVKRDIEYQNNRNKKYCSSKVEIIKNWVNVKNIIKNNEYGFALTLYLKLLKKIDFNSIKGNTFLLIDHEQHFKLALALSRLLNIRENRVINIEKEIQYNSLKRFKLFPEKSNVVILTSIIATSETIRRLVKYVKRDNAVPSIVLCLRNHRKYNISKIQTWGAETDIISIYQENSIDEEKKKKNFDFFGKKNVALKTFNGIVIQPNYTEKPIQKIELISKDLLELFKKTKSLHYNHIGVKNDRHFTFYVNKSKLLNEQSFIWNSIEREINNWKALNKIEDFTIYIKSDLLQDLGNSNFLKFLKIQSKENVEIFTKSPILEYSKTLKADPSKANVFVIDFGVISGYSVNEILNNSKGLDNLHLCILFNQNNSKNFEHYKRIISISDNESDLGEESKTNVKINFLFNLPLSYYNRDNCPICNHNEALDIYKMSDDSKDYMFNFSEDRQLKLAIRDKEEIFDEEYPFDFYYIKNDKIDHELSSEIIAKMFYFKTLLEDSIENTYSRIKLYNIIFDAFNNKEIEVKNPDSNLYAILYFLSFEVHWLQKEPLVFRDFREMLSEISYFIVTYDFESLRNYFKNETNYNANPLGCVTRYKYSAISLLRSTNKLRFCETVSDIITNSYNSIKYSDNLLQNCFYHTYSILKNKYNKSSKYFEKLIESYYEIKNLPNLSDGQKFTSTKLYYLLFSKLTEVDIDNLNDLELIKLLKKYIHESYTGFGHPQLETNINDINLEHISGVGLSDLLKNKADSKYYITLKTPLIDSGIKWEEIQRYLYEKIIPIYKKLSNEIKNSTTFKDEYQLLKALERISDTNSDSILHHVNKLINQLSTDPLLYLDIKREYDEILNFISQRLIRRDSDLLIYLEQFPLDIQKVLDERELKLQFPQLSIKLNANSLVFYPETKFKKDIASIINSIKSRLLPEYQNEEFKNLNIFTDVNLNIESSEDKEFLYLSISYDKTSGKSHHHDSTQKGGLESIQNEFLNYRGDVLFERRNDDNGVFNITFKFLKYE